MNDENKFALIISLTQLLESKSIINKDNNGRSKVLIERVGQLLDTIPELEAFLNESDNILRNKLFVEIGRYIKFLKYEKGSTIKHLGEGDKFFYMTIYGKILKLNIVYKTIYASLKEYVLYLSKLLILKEKYLYSDCIKKNQKLFKLNEKVDIIEYGKNIKSFDFMEEINKIRQIYNEIFLLNLSEEERNKKKLNITELLSLYNPEIKEKKQILDSEQRFSVILPFFYVDKILDSVSFIGNLNKNHGIKNYSLYLSLNNCDVFYLDKSEIKDDFIFSHYNLSKSDLVTNILFKKHYLFKDIDINFLKKNYAKFFDIVKFKKDKNVILQNGVYEGVFIVMKGVLELKTKRSYYELNELKFNIMNTNANLGNSLDNLRDKKRDLLIQRLLRNPNFNKEANEIKEISFGTLLDTDIFGLTDIYDKNKGIYNFSVKCISDEAELFFVPREIFNSILTNPDIKEKIEEIVKEKIKILNLKIKRFTDLFEAEFDRLSPSLKEENKFLITNNFNMGKKNSNQSRFLSKMIPDNFEYKITPNKSLLKKLFRSGSDSKIIYSKNSNLMLHLNQNQDNNFKDRLISYNKRNNDIFHINDDKNINFNVSTSISRITQKTNSNSKKTSDSKYDEINIIKSLYTNRINHMISNKKISTNKNLSSPLINIKQKSTKNNIFLKNYKYLNYKKSRNYINKFTSKNFYKKITDFGRNRKNEKVNNFFSIKKLGHNNSEIIIMPILNNKYNNNYTLQIK